MLEPLTDEIASIRERAYELAVQVLDDTSQRAALSPEAQRLRARLDVLDKELLAKSPKTHREWNHTVIEAWQDLKYVERERPGVSLRLGREMQARR